MGDILCCVEVEREREKNKTTEKKLLSKRVAQRHSGEKCDGNAEPLSLAGILWERCWQATGWEGHGVRSPDGSVSQPAVSRNPKLCWVTESQPSASKNNNKKKRKGFVLLCSAAGPPLITWVSTMALYNSDDKNTTNFSINIVTKDTDPAFVKTFYFSSHCIQPYALFFFFNIIFYKYYLMANRLCFH